MLTAFGSEVLTGNNDFEGALFTYIIARQSLNITNLPGLATDTVSATLTQLFTW